ncbi:hypothetical protein DESUT3_28850 [Desulfuromonas versatilis]|uniref:Uncharacterized protein n=1 Tax=Desulfuromonas versatilis TaxID=2802975 RepID=A0ABM8HS05_9BACT|nr:hypothetical protein DESUT3_28850 [Desulfuromonas versatilis]
MQTWQCINWENPLKVNQAVTATVFHHVAGVELRMKKAGCSGPGLDQAEKSLIQAQASDWTAFAHHVTTANPPMKNYGFQSRGGLLIVKPRVYALQDVVPTNMGRVPDLEIDFLRLAAPGNISGFKNPP